MDHLSREFDPGSAGATSDQCYSAALRRVDPEIFDAIMAEEKRQRENIELIASENFTSRAVMEAQGSVLTNKYAEGYHGNAGMAGARTLIPPSKLRWIARNNFS